MKRALFARELRSALVPNLVTVGAILVASIALENSVLTKVNPDSRAAIDLSLLVGLTFSGFIFGERCFPPEFKESRSFFLSSLPIARTWVWLCIVSARLLAGLLAIVPVAALRFFWSFEGKRQYLALFTFLLIFAYTLLFSAGALFALLFRRPLYVYVIGLGALSILLGETVLSCSYLTAIPHVPFSLLAGQLQGPPHPSIAVFLSLLLIFVLALSWQFFTEGEIFNVKRRIRHLLLFGMTAVAYLGIVACATSSNRLLAVGGTWSLAPMSSGFGYLGPQNVSPGGRYLAVFESLDGSPSIFRISLVDTRTGRLTGQSLFGASSSCVGDPRLPLGVFW